MMRAAVLTGVGGREMLEVRADVPVPEPADGEVLIAVSACGINNTDINTRTGWYSRSVTEGTTAEGSASGFVAADSDDSTWGGSSLELPRIQGADPCGRVVAVAAGADLSLVGERVLVDPWLRHPDDPGDRERARYLGSECDGGFAEYLVAPALNVHVVRSPLSDAELATFPCSWSTAEHMVRRARLHAGQTVVITGASGGVGSAAVQLAKRRRAFVVAVAGAAKLSALSELGADATVSRSDDRRVPAAAADAASGPVDAVLDVVGGPDFSGWLDVLRRGGHYVTCGAIAGPVVDLDLRKLYLKDLQLCGATVYEPGLFAELVGYIERGEVRPVLAGAFPLEQIAAAQTEFMKKRHIGSYVVTI